MDIHSDQEDDDDDFSDLYKEYTGPPVLNKSILERPVTNKRSLSGSDEEHEDPDPNAVPTDFTSREKKVWDAKSKATERNWKKRKEEEMICKLCGDSGHFTQGCPSTLGANGKEFFQRVAARDKHVRALFTGKIMTDIEMEIGCKLRLDEKFLFVSGKDRLILAKGVDAVHRLINDDVSKIKSSNCTSPRAKSPDTSPADSRIPHSDSCKTFSRPRNVSQPQLRFSKHDKAVKDCVRDEPQKDYSNSKTSRSRSPDRSSADVSVARADPHKTISSPRIVPQVQPRYNKHDKAMEDCVREDLQRMCKDSPQAYGSTGARGPSSHSMSPRHRMYSGDSSSMYGSQSQSMAPSKPNECDTERLRSVITTTSSKVENLEFTQSFDDLELEFKSEAINLSVIKDKEEDEENYRHREAIREIRELYIKKLSSLRSAHAKQWEEFLQRDAKRRNQQLDSQRQIERLDVQHVASGYGGDRQASNVASHQYTGPSYLMDANGRYSNVTDDYVSSSRVNDSFSEYHRQRRDDVGRNYTRY
uniref:CCHC-type domain-containing protein n=1 Tax=Kalanchoe fedtschenkoi TaxID=63787 RepID=A0A7N0TTG4_KALFE